MTWRKLPWSGVVWIALAVCATAIATSTPHLLTVPLVAKLGITPERLGVSRGTLELLVRKSGHVTLFAMLGFGMRYAKVNRGWACFAGLLWAVCDEYRQTFIPGRDGRFSDVFIDLSGVMLGVLMASFVSSHHSDEQQYHEEDA